MTAAHHRRKTAMQMLRRGEITVSEAAAIALVSRQRVREWCRNASIDPQSTRSHWLARILTKMNRLDGKR